MKQQRRLDVKHCLPFLKLQKHEALFLAFCSALTLRWIKNILDLSGRQVTRAKRLEDEAILAHKAVAMHSFPGDV